MSFLTYLCDTLENVHAEEVALTQADWTEDELDSPWASFIIYGVVPVGLKTLGFYLRSWTKDDEEITRTPLAGASHVRGSKD